MKEKIKNVLKKITIIFAVVFVCALSVLGGFNSEKSLGSETLKVEDPKLLEPKKANSQSNDFKINLGSKLISSCLLTNNNLEKLIISFKTSVSLNCILVDNRVYIVDYSFQCFIYKSSTFTLFETPPIGIYLTNDYDTPLRTEYNVPLAVYLDTLESLTIYPSFSLPYNSDYSSYGYSVYFTNKSGLIENSNWYGMFEAFSKTELFENYGSVLYYGFYDNHNFNYVYNLSDLDFSTFIQSSYESGYYQGLEDQQALYESSDSTINKIWNLLSNSIESVFSIFSFEILPGIPLYVILVIPFIFGIIFFIWKGGAS